MNVFRWVIRFCALAVTIWFIPAAALAQSSTTAAAPEDRVRALEERIDRLAESLAAAQGQVEQDRRAMQSMQAEIDDLKKTVGGSADAATSASAAQLQQAVTQIREEQDVIASEVHQHEQTKVESASKLPVRLHGMVLFNAFVNEGVVDQPDLPTSALERTGGQSHGSVGGTLRQTLLGIEGAGPAVWGGRLTADVSMDFFGGIAAGVEGSSAGIARMRTGGVSWQRPHDLVRVGYDGPLISPLSPDSIATVAQPALAWSGNLWTWAPQIRWQHLFDLTENRQAGLELGLYDPSYSALDMNASLRGVTPGEAARQPGYETRVSIHSGKGEHALQMGAAGYYDRKNYGSGQTLDTWAGAADWLAPIANVVRWSGEFYRGRGIGSLGGGAYRDAYVYADPQSHQMGVSALDSIGGWTQVQLRFTAKMQLNAVAGEDTGYAGELRENIPQGANPLQYYARNRSLMSNFIYRPWSSFLFSPEFRRLNSWPIYGAVQSANIFTVSAGYEF